MKKNTLKRTGGILLAAALSVSMASAAFAGMGDAGGRGGNQISVSEGISGGQQNSFGGSQNSRQNGLNGGQNSQQNGLNGGQNSQQNGLSGGQNSQQNGLSGGQNSQQNGLSGGQNSQQNGTQESVSVPESKDAAPEINADGSAKNTTSETGTQNQSFTDMLKQLIDTILNVLKGENGTNDAGTSSGMSMEGQKSDQNGRQRMREAGDNIQAISSSVSSLEDGDEKDSLTSLLTAYTNALDAEKAALDTTENTAEDSLSTLRENVKSAREALMEALKEAGITPSVPELPNASGSDAEAAA